VSRDGHSMGAVFTVRLPLASSQVQPVRAPEKLALPLRAAAKMSP